MVCVYILYDYEEYGPENLVVTLNKKLVLYLFDKKWGKYKELYPEHKDTWDLTRDRLKQYLEESDEMLIEYDGVRCSDGWGGVVLHVSRLEED